MKIGLVYAMSEEICTILKDYGTTDPLYHLGMSFYEASENIVAVAGGIGKANIAAATALLCELYKVNVVINCGLSGCFTDYPNGTVVLIDRCVQHDFDTSVIGDEPGLVATVNIKDFYTDMLDFTAQLLTDNNVEFKIGACASGDWFATDGERAELIYQRFNPTVADMEAAAIAQICHRAGVKFIALKGVSDHLNSGKQDSEFSCSLESVTGKLNNVAKLIVDALDKENH